MYCILSFKLGIAHIIVVCALCRMPPLLLEDESARVDASQMPRLISVDNRALQRVVMVPPRMHNTLFVTQTIVNHAIETLPLVFALPPRQHTVGLSVLGRAAVPPEAAVASANTEASDN